MRKSIYASIIFLAGIIAGGYLFSNTQPRSILALTTCHQTCLKSNELLGLLASVGIGKFDTLLSPVVYESDKILVVNYPNPTTSFHEVIIPKKDIKDITQVAPEDMPYISETFAYVAKAVKEHHLVKYKVITNGPGYQIATYLHFHLIGEVGK